MAQAPAYAARIPDSHAAHTLHPNVFCVAQVYTKSDSDGEYAGFTISGHLLRNESVLNRADPEYDQLPLMLTQPLAVVQVHWPRLVALPWYSLYGFGFLAPLLVADMQLSRAAVTRCVGVLD